MIEQDELRKQAEAVAREKSTLPPESLKVMSPEETQVLIHELRVHQIELELQNKELRRLQQDMDAARARYFDLYNMAPVGYVTVSDKGLILESNLTAATLIGVSRGSLIKRPLSRYILPDDQNIYFLHRKQLFETGEPQTCDLRMVKNDGTQFWAHLAATAAQDSDSALVCRVVISDITERKLAEQAYKDSEFKYRSLIEHSSDVVFCVDRNGEYKFVNQVFASTFGKTPDYFLGKTFWDIYPKEHADYRQAASSRVFETGESQSVEVTVPLPDRTLYFLAKTNPVRDETGNVVLNLTHATDITALKQAEESLRESEERLRNAQRIGKLGSLDWNLATKELLLSEETLAIFGFKKGKNIFAIEEIIPLLHPEDKQRVEKSLNDAIANKAHYDLEHRIIRSDGEVIYVRAMAELFHDTDGKSLRFMGTIRNITDRKQAEAEKTELEAQNRQLQKAESLGRMAGAIAHHFNNQLYAVMGNLEMAMDDLPLGVNSNESLVSAMLAARKAAEVSRLMLTYLGQTPGKHVSIDLSEACRQSVTLLQAAVPKGTILNADFPSCGPIIHADSGQMHQILTNLVTNAWESISDNRGTIALTVKTVSHSDIPTSNRFSFDWQPQSLPYACLEVSDTGCGISNKDIEKLFDPFFTTKFTGRGLGLPVAMGIIKSHGGGVTVESEPERGSVFRVFFPVSPEELPIQHDLPVISEALLAGKAEKASKIEAGGTVLLIEDEEQVRKMAKIMLTRLGYTVLEAKDGVEAVEVFKQHRDEIRCVLSDLTMPRMNGWETLTALRKLSPDVPVILSSGYDEAQVMAGEHTEIPTAFLGKPYQLKGLRDTINRVLSAKAGDNGQLNTTNWGEINPKGII